MQLTRHSTTQDGTQLYKGPDDNIYDGAGKLIHDRSKVTQPGIIDKLGSLIPGKQEPIN